MVSYLSKSLTTTILLADYTNIHIPLFYQSRIRIHFCICLMLMRNAKDKQKIKVLAVNKILVLPSFHFPWKSKDELINSSDPSSGLTGLEPAASALTGRCSDQLNYNPDEVYRVHIGFIQTVLLLPYCNRNRNNRLISYPHGLLVILSLFYCHKLDNESKKNLLLLPSLYLGIMNLDP